MGDGVFDQPGVDELRARLTVQAANVAAAQAEFFAIVRDIDRLVDAGPVLRAMRVEQPREVIRTAHLLGDLPELEKAFAAGEVNQTHVRIVERTVRQVRKVNPDAIDDATLVKIDSVFVPAARELPPRQLQTVANRLLAHLDPDGGDHLDPRQVERRELLIWDEPSGMVGVKGRLDPVTGMWFKAAVDRFAKPDPAAHAEPATHPDQDGLPAIRDPRSKGQRQADALQTVCRLALAGRRDPDRPHVVIHTDAESNTSGLTRAWFGRLVCDADLEQLTIGRNAELNLGRKVRTATPVQRRALIARDQTCVIPGCTIPAEWGDAHHVEWWCKGGTTDVANLAMVCGRHHTDIHSGTWSLEMRDGIPWAKPPAWLDPQQRWRRNTYTDHRRAAEQLAINLNPEPDDPG